jgi:5-methyltetrahydrofolate--homocysteine methyltransferase
MLYHAVQHGLDLAIFNASKVIPVAKIDPDARRVFEDLLYDRRSEGYDPLKDALARFSTQTTMEVRLDDETLSPDQRLQRDVLDGEKQRVVVDVDAALAAGEDPLRLINEVLLGAMRIVGERFGSGEMQLPFVLESAEAMKAAIRRIEPVLPRNADYTKGRIILATVRGDVHDIGKNLVDIILSNNGFEVRNLGIKQPIEVILQELGAWPADALGLSGLLVKSTVIMRENLQILEERGLRIPVILGGAALTRDYVEGSCRQVYSGPVLYAEDAFEGLRHMQSLLQGDSQVPPEAPPATLPAGGITIVKAAGAAVPLTEAGQSSWIRRDTPPPAPPFLGVRDVQETVAGLFEHLDDFVVLRQRWGYSQGSLDEAAFQAVLRDKAEPELAHWKARLLQEDLLKPRARYGYFPVASSLDTLHVFSPDHPDRELARITLPRQPHGRRLCIADYFRTEAEGRDVIALQLVTLGEEAAAYARELYAQERFKDYFAFHGLATELTEAFAERLHARIRRELGIHHRDASTLRQLFAQGYQGSRYSFGYPACPDLEGNAPILDLLHGADIGVHLSESFQMAPEFSTTALVAWHPQARYFSV